MILRAIGIALIVASPLSAQAVSSLAPPATTNDISTAIGAATPPDCPAPMSDALVASAGTQPRCMTRSDAVRATQVQPTTALTDANGNWSTSWPAAFGAVPSVATATILGGTPPYICSITAKTQTTVTGRCYGVVSTTLPTATTALLGLVVSPVNNPAAGLTVMIVGRL